MKRRYAVVALALVVGLSTISPALGGPSPVAVVADGAKSIAKKALGKSKKANKKARKAKKLAKQNAKLIAQLDRDQALAYFGSAGNLIYGDGVTTEASNPSPGEYKVTFDRDLKGCVAFANSGQGDPSGNSGVSGGDTVANAFDITSDDQVEVVVFDADSSILTNRAFTVAVFC